MIPRKDERDQVMRETRKMARQLGHSINEFKRETDLAFRGECVRCEAEVYVTYGPHSIWTRYPGWDIQHTCTPRAGSTIDNPVG